MIGGADDYHAAADQGRHENIARHLRLPTRLAVAVKNEDVTALRGNRDRESVGAHTRRNRATRLGSPDDLAAVGRNTHDHAIAARGVNRVFNHCRRERRAARLTNGNAPCQMHRQ